jgi:hypothetical protein
MDRLVHMLSSARIWVILFSLEWTGHSGLRGFVGQPQRFGYPGGDLLLKKWCGGNSVLYYSFIICEVYFSPVICVVDDIYHIISRLCSPVCEKLFLLISPTREPRSMKMRKRVISPTNTALFQQILWACSCTAVNALWRRNCESVLEEWGEHLSRSHTQQHHLKFVPTRLKITLSSRLLVENENTVAVLRFRALALGPLNGRSHFCSQMQMYVCKVQPPIYLK